MANMADAIDGTIIMTAEIVESIGAIYDYRVPRKWQFDPTGAEISWLTPSLSGWIKGLLDRHYQLNSWISKERPPSFWLTGFFNPQGFLTAMKQEVTRAKKVWSLDNVEYTTDVIKEVIQGDDGRIEGRTIQAPQEGVYIHGLYLEGAGWNRAERRLEDSNPKELFYQFPIIHVSATSTVKDPNDRGSKKPDLETIQKALYMCPVYKYTKRNDKYKIFFAYLKPEAPGGSAGAPKGMTPQMKWRLCGVALLCQKD